MADRPRSRLPQDPEYWEGLARAIRADAAGPLAAYAAARETWYGVLARRAPWLVAASVAAMLVLFLALPAPGSPALGWMERALAPDEVAGALVGGPEPPGVEVLLAQFPPAANPGIEEQWQR